MSNFLELKFREFLSFNNLENSKLLLSISGGVDSRVLLHVASLCCKPTNLGIFYVNHQTKTSLAHALFVKNLAKKYKITYFQKNIINNSNKNKENNWRKSRENFKLELLKQYNFEKVLTAHHATDLVETMIFRLVKGCGVTGLSPFNYENKPFWEISKQDLIKYAQQHNLKFVKDPSNENNEFQRNLIRNKVLPELRQITPNLEQVFVREAKIFHKTDLFLQKSLNIILDKLEHNKILLTDFLNLEEILKEEFFRKISEKTPSESELRDLLKWLNNNPQGNSQKKIGNKDIKIIKNYICW